MARLFTVIALLAVAALSIWRFTRPEPVPVLVQAAERGLVEATVANTRAGTVKACRRARLSLAVGGQIARLEVKEGDKVEAGALLLELWNDDLKAQLELARKRREVVRARVEEACALAAVAHQDRLRIERLFREKAAARESLDKAIAQARAKEAGCTAAKAELEAAGLEIEARRAALERTILRAPFAGIVAEVNGELAEFVTPSPIGVATPPAVDLIDGCCLYVSAPVDEVDAPAIEVGMEARISLDAFPGRRFPGRVRRIAPYVRDVERQSRTVDVEADFLEPGVVDELMPGYSADIEILIDRREHGLRVPTEAVLDGRRVLVLENGRLAEREIRTGLHNWRWTEVTEGLREGELVVTSVDREGVKPGAPAVAESSMEP